MDRAMPDGGAGQGEGGIFNLRHSHTGAQGDGHKIRQASIDTAFPLAVGLEFTYIPVNAKTSGRKYRLQVIEVLNPETNVLQPVIQIVPA